MKKRRDAQKKKVFGPKKIINWPKRGVLSKDFWNSATGRFLLIVMVMGLGIFMRLSFLSADPPLNLSWSQDVNTDPGQYTSFARNKVLWGEWDPFGSPYLVLWINSAYTLISFLFFTLLGVGRGQDNLVAAGLSFLTLVFFYLAIKRGANQKSALLATFFLSINYILVMYSRNTFAEVPTLFFIVLGIYLLVLGLKRRWFLIFSGACFASSILFCKMLAIFILPVSLGVLILTAKDEFPSNERKINKWLPTLFFVGGLLLVTLPWFLIIYYPFSKTVAGFVSGMSVGMYGSPQAFRSVSDFIYSLFSLGAVTRVFISDIYSVGTDLFFRMPLLFILSFLFLLVLFFKILQGKSIFKNLRSCSKLELFFGLWLVVGILALMPWNYRPLRYQILIIPPLCALAAFCLSDFLNPSEVKNQGKSSIWFWIFSIPTASLLIFHTLSFFLKIFQKIVQLNSIIIISFFLSFPFTYLFLRVKRKKTSSVGQAYKIIVVAIVVLLILLIQGGQFLAFARNVQYSFLCASKDLGQILNSKAVISGPYSQTLIWDNRLGYVWHMFVVTTVDPELFRRYPITHLAMEARGGQREQAFKDYPQVMMNAKSVATYYLRNFPVEILRVAQSSENQKVRDYQLSDFEKAKLLLDEGQIDSALIMLHRFVDQHPHNSSGYKTLAEIYYDRKDFEKAGSFLEKASEFDPTDFSTHQFLGVVYLELYDQKRDDTYRVLAIKEYEKALKLFPQNRSLSDQLKNIRGY
jgi:4-amino-4-deoxy-L-arabinose transferase-like glycosyltransferase